MHAQGQEETGLGSSPDCAVVFARAYPALGLSARIKAEPDDFVVDEICDISLSGEGEHCWCQLRKRSMNTEWLARKIAEYCAVKPQAVSYAGLKDRHAVTSQWFSVHLPGKPAPDWAEFVRHFNSDLAAQGESIELLDHKRHNRKLQRGALQANRFSIRLSELNRSDQDALSQLQQRCRDIAVSGVPNYFGEQRFGHDRMNVQRARDMLSGKNRRTPRHKRSIYLSAARSWIFNRVLTARVEAGSWDKALPGDVFMLEGSNACFADDASEQIPARLVQADIHPAIVLWGENESMVKADARALEMLVLAQEQVLRDGLCAARVKASRRAARLLPGNLECHIESEQAVIEFVLPAGAYATVVLDEIITVKD